MIQTRTSLLAAEAALTCTREEWTAVPLGTLVSYARRRADITSVRAVALEVGIGRTTLHKYLSGRVRRPEARVQRLLALWYLGRIAERKADASAALAVLVEALPEDAQAAAAADLLDVVERAFTAAGLNPPPWMPVVRATFAEPGAA
jgi:hypothetical protein